MPFSINVVGDISFQGKNADKPSVEIFSSVASYLKKSSLTVANLENPLLKDGDPVPGKCTLRGSTGWAEVLREAGISVLSLANNHMMDYGRNGLFSTINALNNAGLLYVGAGNNKDEACAPAFIDIDGLRIAFLGRTSVIVSSPSYATDTLSGVALFDLEETKANIKACKEQADLVILLIHWGLEEYYYPSPHQRILASELIQAGADLILGHHPHVLQGVENFNSGLVCYSLGNFVFHDIEWSLINKEGQQQLHTSELTQDNRRGGVLKVTFLESSLEFYEFFHTFIQSDGTVVLDNVFLRKRQFEHLCSRLRWRGYSLFWRAYSVRQEWRLRLKPLIQGKITWAGLKKLRPMHFRQLMERVRRSTKIAAEKSTNPYE